jgi:hypothetical protein
MHHVTPWRSTVAEQHALRLLTKVSTQQGEQLRLDRTLSSEMVTLPPGENETKNEKKAKAMQQKRMKEKNR